MPKRKRICPALDEFMATGGMSYGARKAEELHTQLRQQRERTQATVDAVKRMQANMPPPDTFVPDDLATTISNILAQRVA
ncbi:MAG: hypothetical protein QOF32_1077 [Gammaproteobacteria bacterium]|jgi:hypothetical protein|nr:hypothetical protein [Gammaproteobacteria bacterium]